MVLRHYTLLKPFLTLRYIHKYICKMNKVYLRHLAESEKFEISFHYFNSDVNVNRQFNLYRQLSETISSFTSRVAINVEKVIKKKSKNQAQKSVNVFVSVNGNPVEDDSVLCGDIFKDTSNQIKLNVDNQEYDVIINSPWISSIALPTSILANFPVYPTKFESVYTDRDVSKYCWFKSRDKNKWTQVGEGFIYEPSNSDIEFFLKISCIPKTGKVEGPRVEVVSTVQVQAGPGFCPFETRHEFTRDRCEGKTFRIVSYNILADLYCDSDFTRKVLHPYCPPYALSIDYRKQLIIKEVKGYNADLICLQEVDTKVYNRDLQPAFERLGYNSDFCLKRGLVAEGLAFFYNKEKFKLLQSFRLVLSDELSINPLFLDIWEKIKTNKDLNARILDRSTVLQVNIVDSLDNDEILVVANTHLYFHPDADHIRLLQGAVTIRYLEHVISKIRKKYGKRSSLIFCGDFNSVPECGIYQLFTTGAVQEDHTDFRSNAHEAIKIPLRQSLCLKSACGTPKYTNFTAGFADCLDYIYYEAANFEVIQVVPFPSVDELTQHTALPSIVFPSDHIALVSDLRWT